jgi:hypothetical protein
VTPPTVLIVSPHFPPSTLAGVHRARLMAKHLPAHGWRPVVLRVHERHYREPGDPALAALVPNDIPQVRTGAVPASLCRLAGVGDIGLRGYPWLGRALARLIVEERPGVVFITGYPFYPMLLARGLEARFRTPVVLDFQDPWVRADAATAPAQGLKGRLADKLAAALEPAALRAAAFVTSVSDVQNDDMARRYPWLDRERMAAIPVGGDPDDFAALRAEPPGGGRDPPGGDLLNIYYVGTFLPRAAPLIERLFAALATLRAESPTLAARLQLHFVGTSNQPSGVGGRRVHPHARAFGVADLVHETPERVPYLAALGLLARADGLLLIGSDEPHYTASKIYPALLSGRPWLSLFHRASSAHRILSTAGGGRAIAFSDAAELDASTPALVEALRVLATHPQSFGKVREDAIAPYLAGAMAARFAGIFTMIARS